MNKKIITPIKTVLLMLICLTVLVTNDHINFKNKSSVTEINLTMESSFSLTRFWRDFLKRYYKPKPKKVIVPKPIEKGPTLEEDLVSDDVESIDNNSDEIELPSDETAGPIADQQPEPPVVALPIKDNDSQEDNKNQKYYSLEKSHSLMDWSNVKDSQKWTKVIYNLMDNDFSTLLNEEPKDINSYCPEYKSWDDEERKIFWMYLVSVMSKFESGHNPNTTYRENFKDSKGNYIISTGLLQLSDESGRGYGCHKLTNHYNLKDAALNLKCGLTILERWVDRDQVIGTNSPHRGAARYWAIFRASKKAKTQAKTLNFCRLL